MTAVSRALPALLVSLALVAACAGPAPSAGSPSPSAPAPTGASPSASGEPSATPGGSASPSATAEPSASGATRIVRAYFVVSAADGKPGLVPVLREVADTTAVATAAMTALVAGPTARERGSVPNLVTTIPAGTRFLGVTVVNGTATVDLSREFEGGGGSLSLFMRIAQVVYTLTQFSSVTGVRFALDGQLVEMLGGEGIMVDRAIGRSDYRDDVLRPIFLDRPAWGAAFGNPGRVMGLANVFEASFQVAVLDGGGRTLAQETVMATCGTGCWGTFDVTIPYTVDRAGWGTLRAWEPSAKDGSPINVIEYPVWLTPGG